MLIDSNRKERRWFTAPSHRAAFPLSLSSVQATPALHSRLRRAHGPRTEQNLHLKFYRSLPLGPASSDEPFNRHIPNSCKHGIARKKNLAGYPSKPISFLFRLRECVWTRVLGGIRSGTW